MLTPVDFSGTQHFLMSILVFFHNSFMILVNGFNVFNVKPKIITYSPFIVRN